jgi:hypothetical protein
MRLFAVFFWIALPIAGYAAYSLYGLPHMIWSYRFHDNGDPNDPLVKRYYTDCTFVGPYGGFTVPASAGKCGWVKFFKQASGQ